MQDLHPERMPECEVVSSCSSSEGAYSEPDRDSAPHNHRLRIKSAHAGLGDLSRRRPRGHGDSRSVPRARHDRPDDRQELPAPTARRWRRRLRPWTLPAPWTHKPRPPRLGNRSAIPTSVHRHFPWFERTNSSSRLRARKGSKNTEAAYRVAAFQTFLSGRISTFGDRRRISGHFEKHWFSHATRVDVYQTSGRRALPALECLAIHRFQPRRNKSKAETRKWTSKCPLCKVHREIEQELGRIFRLRMSLLGNDLFNRQRLRIAQ